MSLNKETIARLNDEQMGNVRGRNADHAAFGIDKADKLFSLGKRCKEKRECKPFK